MFMSDRRIHRSITTARRIIFVCTCTSVSPPGARCRTIGARAARYLAQTDPDPKIVTIKILLLVILTAQEDFYSCVGTTTRTTLLQTKRFA